MALNAVKNGISDFCSCAAAFTLSVQVQYVFTNTETVAYTAVTIIHAACVLFINIATLFMIGNVNAVIIILAVIDNTIRMLQIVSLSFLSRLIKEPSA